MLYFHHWNLLLWYAWIQNLDTRSDVLDLWTLEESLAVIPASMNIQRVHGDVDVLEQPRKQLILCISRLADKLGLLGLARNLAQGTCCTRQDLVATTIALCTLLTL